MNEPNRFNLVTNGYDCYQVNNEIDRLEYHIQELNERIRMYQSQIETVNNQFAMIKKRYQLLVSELSSREKQADDVARLALKEANSIIDEAQKNADGIIQNAIYEVQGYVDTIKGHKDYSNNAIGEVRTALGALMEALNKYESIEMPDPFASQENNDK